MKYYDIHAHKPSIHPEDVTIVNLIVKGDIAVNSQLSTFNSVGVHPWYIDHPEKQLETLCSFASNPQVVAIGEAGLDKLTETPLSLQEELFLTQAKLAGKVRKPLIIHCVKAWPELIAARKKIAPEMPWVIHGFRGNGILAEQLIRQGFLLSFGEKFNPEALQKAWPFSLLTETDDSETDIRTIYNQLSSALNIPLNKFSGQIEENTNRVFGLIK